MVAAATIAAATWATTAQAAGAGPAGGPDKRRGLGRASGLEGMARVCHEPEGVARARGSGMSQNGTSHKYEWGKGPVGAETNQ